MCEQCAAECVRIGDISSGWTLVQARRDGRWMASGDWGIVRTDDPPFAWRGAFLVDPTPKGLDRAGLAAWMATEAHAEAWGAFDEAAEAFARGLRGGFLGREPAALATVFDLASSCRAAGWDPDAGGLEHWLFDRCAALVVDHAHDGAAPC